MSLSESIHRLADLTEPTRDELKKIEADWVPDLPPDTLAAGMVAVRLARDIDAISDAEIKAVLDLAEQLLREGDVHTRSVIATGFFEALLGETSAGRLQFHRIAPMLGKLSRDHCLAWDNFCGIKTEGLN